MYYRADKPFGRRRTDQTLSPEERSRLQLIRQDVEDDESGLIRRYLRLSEKVLGTEKNEGRPKPPKAKGEAA
jgi:hypothetical protein